MSDTSPVAHVLVTEDNKAAAEAVMTVLKQLNCTVDHAASGPEAMDMLTSTVYDIIFMDVGLPGMTGLDVAREIRNFDDSKKSATPIVGLTGYSNQRHACIQADMQDCLLKPATSGDLADMLARYTAFTQEDSEEDVSIIDWSGCVQRCEGNEKEAERLLVECATNAQKNCVVMREGQEALDVDIMRTELYKILSGIYDLKLPELEDSLQESQHILREDCPDDDELEGSLKGLEEAITNLTAACKERGFIQ